MTPFSELVLLRWLARRTVAAASEIGAACALAPGEVRAYLVALESRRYVGSRTEKLAGKLRRVYYVTAEGRRVAGLSDAEATR